MYVRIICNVMLQFCLLRNPNTQHVLPKVLLFTIALHLLQGGKLVRFLQFLKLHKL